MSWKISMQSFMLLRLDAHFFHLYTGLISHLKKYNKDATALLMNVGQMPQVNSSWLISQLWRKFLLWIYVMHFAIWHHLYNIKNVKTPMKESSMGAFQFFLNCTNGTKSHKKHHRNSGNLWLSVCCNPPFYFLWNGSQPIRTTEKLL